MSNLSLLRNILVSPYTLYKWIHPLHKYGTTSLGLMLDENFLLIAHEWKGKVYVTNLILIYFMSDSAAAPPPHHGYSSSGSSFNSSPHYRGHICFGCWASRCQGMWHFFLPTSSMSIFWSLHNGICTVLVSGILRLLLQNKNNRKDFF